jgi:hypothetical protein
MMLVFGECQRLLQYFFGAAGCFMASMSLASCKAIIYGVIDGETRAYSYVSYGAAIFNVGLTMFLYGDDYGRDPRCFIGWENETRNVFFILMLGCVAVSLSLYEFIDCILQCFFTLLPQFVLFLSFVLMCNMTSPRTRRDSVIDHLAAMCTNFVITSLVFSLTWLFAYPAFQRFPDLENPDFYPIFIILQSWFGVVFFASMGLGMKRFRKAMLGQVRCTNECIKNMILFVLTLDY